MASSFTATYEATPASIAVVRNQMATLASDCGLDPDTIGNVRLAVSEAATNALIHGYREGEGTIRVEASIDAGELVISISDAGLGMAPREDSPGLGLGLPIIAKVARRLEILDGAPGTMLQMAFACPCSPAPDAPALN